jgi:DNA-binding transcriptional LysR family regulator
LSATARALHVNHATVSRRIDAIEAALARTLFDRRADGYAPTTDGQAVIGRAEAMEIAALAVSDAVASSELPAGTVRITTVRSLADLIPAEAFGELSRRAPGITIELLTEMRVLSIARRDADIALRLGRPKDSELVGRKLAEIAYAYYASPKTVKRWARGETIPLIGYDAGSDHTAEFGWLARHFAGHPFSFRSNSSLAQAAAARGSLGVALLPRYVGNKCGGVRTLTFGPAMPNRELWLLTRRDLAVVPRIRLVADFLVRKFLALRSALAAGASD